MSNTKYNIYSKDDIKVAIISVHKVNGLEELSIELLTDDKKQLPHMLQAEQLSSNYLIEFMESRILPKRGHVINEMKQYGLTEYRWQDLIKLNSGRVVTDKFYVLTEENGVEIPKSNHIDKEDLEIISGELE